jgi:diguanylate cyclase (GGDEF)-like protein
VNPDVELGITMLWIDMLVRDGEDVLAVAGTGLDLTEFVNNIVDSHEPGISTVFTDYNGAIQLFREQDRIAFASVVTASEEIDLQPLDGLFDSRHYADQVWSLMQGLQTQPDAVLTDFVTIEGRRHIVGVAYLPEIDWYELTLMDLDVILPLSQFSGLIISFVLILLLSLILMQFALQRYVLKPLGVFEKNIEEMREGKQISASLTPFHQDEIGRLMQRFNEMSESVSSVQRNLEAKVQERTEQLEVLTRTDALTELLNRRGLNQRLEEALNQFQREGKAFGLIWLDMDDFKRINDQLGHDVGDACLKMVAEEIKRVLRPYDSASRWGGDEFMLMISNTDEERIKSIAERLLLAVRGLPEQGDIRLSITVSSCVIQQGETLQNAMKRADEAMYRAKEAGRDRHFAAKRA